MVTTLSFEANVADRFLAYARQKGIDMSNLLAEMLANMIKLDSDKKESLVRLKKEINDFEKLEINWDGYGAAVVNKIAINNSMSLVDKLLNVDLSKIEFMPSHNGAVLFKLKTNNGVVSGEIGDSIISYFVRIKGKETEYHNFEKFVNTNIDLLVSKMEGIC